MKRLSTRTLAALALVITLVVAGVVSFYASGNPDGLEFVAEGEGFSQSAEDPKTSGSPFADYSTTGVDNERVSGGLAGVAGVLIVLVLAGGLAYAVRRRDTAEPAPPKTTNR